MSGSRSEIKYIFNMSTLTGLSNQFLLEDVLCTLTKSAIISPLFASSPLTFHYFNILIYLFLLCPPRKEHRTLANPFQQQTVYSAFKTHDAG